MAIINGTNTNNTLTGAANVVDTIDGLGGNDVLNGGTGADTLIGGLGNDTFTVDSGLDVVIELGGEGIDLVKSSTSLGALFANVENVSLTGSAALDVTGNNLSNSIFGNTGANILNGGGFGEADFMSGGGGNDTYVVDNTGDVLVESSGTDLVQTSVSWTLATGFENLTGTGGGDILLTGNAANNIITSIGNGDMVLNGMNGNDQLNGGTGNDQLVGGTGLDTMAGGDGNDTYNVDNVGDVVNETGTGTDTVQSTVTFSLNVNANLENLTLLGGGNINGDGNGNNNIIVGNTGNNVLNGNGGNDTLNGGTAGNDLLQGGAGTDYYLVNHNGVTVTEIFGDSNADTVETTVSFTLADNVENLLSGADANDYIQLSGNSLNNVINNAQGSAYGELYGNDGVDTLTGGDSGNYLDGGTGADTMTGGASSDQYAVDNAGDQINEAVGEGYDYVYSSVSYTMADNLEELYLQGSSNINGIGNALGNYIEGNSNVNLLLGGDGDDNLQGAGGADIMIGGTGSDGYNVDNIGDSVVENAGEGSSDSVYSSISYTLGAELENLFLTNGSGNTTATGNAGNNAIYGNDGDNILDGAGAATGDYMQGGSGNDVYHVRHLSDTVFEYNNDGTDTVQQYVDYGTTVTLFNDVENLVLNGTVIFGGGNSLINTITGNAEDNTIDGFGGADIMIGGAGNDFYIVDNASDLIIDSSGSADQFFSSASYNMGLSAGSVENGTLLNGWVNINLTGNSLVNILTGNNENNTLNGGAGADTLIGNGGTDAYVVDNAADSVIGNGGDDVIQSSISWNLSDVFTNNVNNLTLTGAGNNNATGNANGNSIVGNSGSNVIDGGAGADNMSGGGGDDTFAVDDLGDVTSENFNEGNDTVNASVNHTIGDNIENLNLTVTGLTGTGNSLNNTITGFSTGASTLFGMGGDDMLVGGTGNDTFDGGTGADFMVGYNGNNVYYVDQAGGIGVGDFVENNGGSAANSIVYSSISWNLGDGNASVNVDNLTFTADFVGGNFTLLGNGNANTVRSDSDFSTANITLNGGAGADTMLDMGFSSTSTTFIVDNAGDTVNASATTATSTVRSSVDFNLGMDADLDNLFLTGATANSATGNAGFNIIDTTGSTNAWNYLDGGNDVVADSLIGSSGTDVYTVRSANDVVTETGVDGSLDQIIVDYTLGSFTYTLANNIEQGFIAAGPDTAGTLIGNGLANYLQNNNAFNGSTLDGGLGTDTMFGNVGNDFFVVNVTGDSVVGNGGTDTILSAVSLTLDAAHDAENLTLTGGVALTATGNGQVNVLTGNSLNNTLDGGAGDDTMIGGLGSDLYIVDATLDVVTEVAGQGTDTVNASANFTLSADVENLVLTGGGNIDGTGNILANSLTGNTGNNTLNGMGGADVMIGGLGSDYYIIDQSGDSITETGADTDTVELNNFTGGFIYTLGASIENGIIAAGPDVSGLGLTGNSLNNTLTNNNTSSGTVSLDGGLGQDTMIGAGNSDVFVVDNAGDNVTGNGGVDDIRSGITWDLQVNTTGVNRLLLTGAGNTNAFGTAAVDTLTGNGGNNTLDGRGGVDLLAGMGGNDTYFVDNGVGEIFNGDSSGNDTVINLGAGAIDLSGRGDLENATLTAADNGNLIGNGNVNILIGDASDNAIDGLGGADTMNGGDGNDAYYVDDAGDVVIDSSGSSDLVYSSVNYTLGAGIESGAINGNGVTLTGNSGDNTLSNIGFSGATLDGGAGADTLNGTAFDETFVVDNAGDSIAGGGGTDTIRSSITWDLNNTNSGGAVHLVLIGAGNNNATGDVNNNSLTGNSGNNTLDGGSGTDAMAGLGGNDTYIVDNFGDTVTESTGGGNDSVFSSFDFTLGTHVENLTLTGPAVFGTGNGSNNNITGNANANTIDGGAGADAMTGGDGDDFYTVDDSGDQVFENFNEGTDTVSASATHTMGANVENLFMTGGANINATGNSLNNIITGNSGNNSLDGGAGTDTLTGGLGNDTYVADSPGDVLVENDGEGADTVIAGFSATLQDYFENLTLSGVLNLNGTGNSVANTITGNSGNNSIDGAGGADVMQGGAGDDTYFVDDAGDTVTEGFNAGTDTVLTDVSFTLSNNVEILTNAGVNAGITLTGNSSGNNIDNTLGLGGDTLDGGGGSDFMIGSVNNDTFIVDNSFETLQGQGGFDQVFSSATWSLGNATDVNVLTLTGATLINGTGTNLTDTITGNTAKNILTGLDGDDTLNGGGGTDTLIGGQGTDSYIVNNLGVTVTEAAGEGGEDTVYSTVNFTLGANVEELVLSGAGGITGTGNAGSNVLSVNAAGGSFTLNGGLGADIMIAGTGTTTTFIVDNLGDIVQGDNAGMDTVLSSVNFAMDGVTDNLTLTGTAANGTGNTLANILTGNASANILDDGGAGGSDVMNGLGGNDTYIVNNSGDTIGEISTGGTGDVIQTFVNFDMTANAAFVENLLISSGADLTINGNALNNTITGNAGWDNISGQAGNDRLLGNDGNDQLFGGIGNDILLGGLDSDILDGGVGKDTLTGGTGQDTFHFSGAVTSTNADIITAADFTNGPGGDILDVSDILVGYNGNITEFVQISNSGTNTLVKVDVNGLAGGNVWTLVATINGVNLGNDELALQGSGNLVVT